MPSVLLTKQAVANRLIVSAIKMFEQDNDPLAAHAVAASAYNLLRELVSTRGQSYGTRIFGVALYEAALARCEGRQPVSYLPSHTAIEAAVTRIAQGIIDKEILSAADVDIDMPRSVEARAIRPIIAPFNFMKHTDRDPNGVLDESDLQPIEAINHAIAAYALLFPNAPLPEDVRVFVAAYIKTKPLG